MATSTWLQLTMVGQNLGKHCRDWHGAMTWSHCHHTLSDLFDICTLTWRNNRSLNISSYFDFLGGCSIYFQHDIFARKIGRTTQKHLVFGNSSSKSIEFELFLHIWYQSLKWRCSSAKKGLWMPESKNGDHFCRQLSVGWDTCFMWISLSGKFWTKF